MRWWALILGVAACSGEIGDPSALPPDPGAPAECRGEVGPTTAPLAHFTRDEFETSLRALFGDDAVDASQSAIDAIPEEAAAEEGTFRRQDGRLSERHIDGYYRVADELAERVATDGALRMVAGGACESGVEERCLEDFVETFLQRAFRRPPESREINEALSRAREFSGTDQIHAVVFTTLMAPDFLYRFENRGDERRGVITLTPYELASRLSYHFWGAPPDAELLAAAEAGDLDNEDRYRAQVDRLFNDPRTDLTLMHFFEEWLHLERGDFADSPRLDVLRGDLEIDGLAEEMREEVDDLIHHYLSEPDGTWDDVMTSPLSFARSERLASIYGVAPWDGESLPPELPATERSGLLTRAGMLFSADGSTNPFRRGVFVRRAILCDNVAPPPATLPPDSLTPPPVEEGSTTREAFEAKVVDEPCASCHAQFSPFGYALEAFDGLGRFRTDEHLVTTGGIDRGFATVDVVVTPRVEGDDTRAVASAVELNQRIAESPKINACLSRQYFRFAYRHEEEGDDFCTLDAWTTALEEGMSLRDALRAVALDEHFRQRLLIEDDGSVEDSDAI
ncbi:MAG: DUF1592 domain-containing protein [Myxococcota bacterium]